MKALFTKKSVNGRDIDAFGVKTSFFDGTGIQNAPTPNSSTLVADAGRIKSLANDHKLQVNTKGETPADDGVQGGARIKSLAEDMSLYCTSKK